MRQIMDKPVMDYYSDRPFKTDERDMLLRMHPGQVRATNSCVFLSHKKAKASSIKERLVEATTRMPGDNFKQKYCMAILSYANVGSIYLSLASQYALYRIITDEAEPSDLSTYVAEAGLGVLLSTLDLSVLTNLVDDIMAGLEEEDKPKSNLEDVADIIE